jgi:hypothetical protein
MDNVRRVFMTLDTEMASPHAAERRIGKQAFLEVLELPKMLRVQFGSIWKFSTLGCLQNWLPFLLFGFLQETMSLTLYGGSWDTVLDSESRVLTNVQSKLSWDRSL